MGARLKGAEIHYIQLQAADLDEAEMQGAWFRGTQMETATTNRKTKSAPGSDSSETSARRERAMEALPGEAKLEMRVATLYGDGLAPACAIPA